MARLLLTLVSATALAATPPAQQARFHAGADTVALYATVTDRQGAFIGDLRKEDFEVRDSGVPREVVVFGSGTQPITAVLLLDMNGSPRDIPWLQAAGEEFLSALQPEDRIRLGTFGDEIMITPRLTGDRAYLT